MWGFSHSPLFLATFRRAILLKTFSAVIASSSGRGGILSTADWAIAVNSGFAQLKARAARILPCC